MNAWENFPVENFAMEKYLGHTGKPFENFREESILVERWFRYDGQVQSQQRTSPRITLPTEDLSKNRHKCQASFLCIVYRSLLSPRRPVESLLQLS